MRFGLDGGYPPFASPDPSGQLKDFDIDLGETICAELTRKCTWVRQEWEALIPALNTNRFDAILVSMVKTPEHKKVVAFTKPYHKAKAIFVGPIDSKLASINATDIAGKPVGIEASTIYGNDLTAVYGDSVTIREYPSLFEVFSDLQSCRIDSVLKDANSIHHAIEHGDGKGKLRYIGQPIEDPSSADGAGIAVRKDNTQLVSELDAALDRIVKDGRYAEINERCFPYGLR